MKKTIFTLAAVAASLATSHGAAIHNGLINYWPLDGDAVDSAGSLSGNTSTNASNGAIAGTGVSFTGSGLFGGAADFERDLGNNGRIEILDSAAGTDTDRTGRDVSLSFWVNVESFGTNWQAMIAHGEGSDYRVARSGGSLTAAYAGGTGDITNPTDISTGWHHIVATTTNLGAVSLTIDGGAPTTGAGPAGIVQTNIAALYIGNNPGSGTRMHDGLIDDVGMWDRVLSSAEIGQIYQSGLAGTSLGAIPEPTAGLLGLLGLGLVFRRRR